MEEEEEGVSEQKERDKFFDMYGEVRGKLDRKCKGSLQ